MVSADPGRLGFPHQTLHVVFEKRFAWNDRQAYQRRSRRTPVADAVGR